MNRFTKRHSRRSLLEVFLIPEGWGDREPKVRSIRWPKSLIDRVEKIAGETNQDWTDVVLFLTRWGCDEWEARAGGGKSSKR